MVSRKKSILTPPLRMATDTPSRPLITYQARRLSFHYTFSQLNYFILFPIEATGAASKINQTVPTGGCSPGSMGGVPCLPQQVTPVGGCGSIGRGTPCPSQGMPVGSSMCGGGSMGGSPCVTIDAGCVQIGSQPMGGAPCPAPAQGMAMGACPGMESSCVIQGTLTEGCPNATTGGNSSCPPAGNTTGGCVSPGVQVGTCGPNGTTNGNTTGGPNPIINPAPSEKICSKL